MSLENEYLENVPQLTELSLPPAVFSAEYSGTSPESLAQAFSDPDPTTMVVSGSEKDASGGERNTEKKRLAAVRGGNKGGNGYGENTGTKKFGESATRERKLKVLTFCYEHGFVTRRIAVNFLLSGVDSRSAARILERLIELGLLVSRKGNWATRRGVYQLTPKGMRVAEFYSEHKGLRPFRIKPDEIDHDETTMEVRILLERLLGGRWLPERSLKTERRREIPDGILYLSPRAKIAIEVELTDKGKTRLWDLLGRWEEDSVSLVLYVCGDENMTSIVQKSMGRFPEANHLATIALDSLRAGKKEIWTPDGEMRLFTEAEVM